MLGITELANMIIESIETENNYKRKSLIKFSQFKTDAKASFLKNCFISNLETEIKKNEEFIKKFANQLTELKIKNVLKDKERKDVN